MRINIYAEELPDQHDPRATRVVEKRTETGRVFFGERLYLHSPRELHDTPDDDDRSAITIWGPRAKVAALLRRMADEIDGAP